MKSSRVREFEELESLKGLRDFCSTTKAPTTPKSTKTFGGILCFRDLEAGRDSQPPAGVSGFENQED